MTLADRNFQLKTLPDAQQTQGVELSLQLKGLLIQFSRKEIQVIDSIPWVCCAQSKTFGQFERIRERKLKREPVREFKTFWELELRVQLKLLASHQQ